MKKKKVDDPIVQHKEINIGGLTAPWDEGKPRIPICEIKTFDPDTCNNFIKERTRVHELYIREQAINKRFGLALAFALIVLAGLAVLFAPEGRETVSYWIGAALLIFAAGAVGFGRVWGKAAMISFGADQDRRKL